MRKTARYYTLLSLLCLGLAACGGDASEGSSDAAAVPADPSGLTQEQLEKGIGPIREVSLAADVEADLAAKGAQIFAMKCSACHKLDQRYVGPELGGVLSRRKPEYVMNMILNTQEMVQKHPVVKELLAQFMTPMPNQSLTEDEARSVLEYLRQENQKLAQ
jgi:cytochrome c